MEDTNMMLISPEALEIAQAYLINKSDSKATADALGLPIQVVETHLAKKEVQRYIDRIFNESGFRNRDRMAQVWDAVLEAKLQEMDDTGLGSAKDIVEILEKMHSFKMKELELQIKLQQADTPTIQVNQQNNIGGGNYNKLLEKLLNPTKE